MTKQEFLHELQTALQGEIGQTSINENIKYYDSYIMEETRKGKTEEDVIERLGNPRLIAKTLIDTTEQFGTYGKGGYYSEDDMQDGAGGFRGDYQKQRGWNVHLGRWNLNTWYGKLIMIIAAIFLIVIVANVVAFLLPLLAPIILLLLIYSLIFGSRR